MHCKISEDILVRWVCLHLNPFAIKMAIDNRMAFPPSPVRGGYKRVGGEKAMYEQFQKYFLTK